MSVDLAKCEHESTVEVTRFADQRICLLCNRCGAGVDGGPR